MEADNNSSSICGGGYVGGDVAAQKRLSENLRSIFRSAESEFFADARVVVGGGRMEIAVHRCVLSGRSRFFRAVFGSTDRVEMGGLGFEPVAAVLGYLYGATLGAPPEGVCSCVDDDCPHSTCRPAVDFMVESLCASFTFQVSELVDLFQRNLSKVIDGIAIDDILVVLSAASKCGEACEGLVKRCVEIVAGSDLDTVALEKALPQDTVKEITDSRSKRPAGQPVDHRPESQPFPDKHAKRIHRALESDDVELVRMLLREGHTSLDEARALHFAVAHCDAKTTTELLDLGLADVNRQDPRGYTVLHAAAMRRDPKIIVSLLTKGARPSDLTSDGRKALQIAKRVTRASDYHRLKASDDGKGSSPRDRLCIEILEQAERRAPLFGEASVSLAMAGDDLRMKLLYLENRVGLAKLLIPMEAKVVMDISHMDETSEFLNGLSSKRTAVDLNEAPFKIQEEHLIRLNALSKTVELGKRFFPRCSDALNKIMDGDELSQLAYLGHDTPAERLLKKRRYLELQKVLGKAFNEDKDEIDRLAISSSSSSTSIGVVTPNAKLSIN